MTEVPDRAGVRRRRDPAEGTHRQQRLLVDAAREELVVRPVPEVVRRDRPAGERAEDEEQDEAAAGDRDPVAAEAEPDELPVAARANCSNDVDADLAVGLGGDRRRQASRRRDELRTFGRGHPRAASYSKRATMSLAASKSKAPLVLRFLGRCLARRGPPSLERGNGASTPQAPELSLSSSRRLRRGPPRIAT